MILFFKKRNRFQQAYHGLRFYFSYMLRFEWIKYGYISPIRCIRMVRIIDDVTQYTEDCKWFLVKDDSTK